jgi:hypothetical protein
MSGSTYIKCNSGASETLQTFAATLFHALNISCVSRHESANYFGEEYFVGQALGVKATVALADDSEFCEYKFWLTISADGVWTESKAFFEDLADLVARYLTMKGFQVARDPDSGRVGGRKLIYSRRDGESICGREQIDVRQIP